MSPESLHLLRFDPPYAPHALRQAPGVGVEELLELLALLDRERRLELVHRALERGIRHRGARRLAQLRQDRLRRALRREDAGPDVELGLGITQLLEGRHIRQGRHALAAAPRQRTELA